MKNFYCTYEYEQLNLCLTIFQEDELISCIEFGKYDGTDYENKETTEILNCKNQLFEYFSGKRKVFDISYKLPKYSDFQQSVIDIVSKIPFGSTMSYSKIAEIAGHKNAGRAVGTVMAKNNLPIIIPCHRVVKADLTIGNYAGGKQLKEKLLNLEKSN